VRLSIDKRAAEQIKLKSNGGGVPCRTAAQLGGNDVRASRSAERKSHNKGVKA